MPVLSWAAHHRLLTFGLGFALVILAVAAGVWFFVLRSPGTPFGVKQALRLYRLDQRDGKARAPRLPVPGVYRYRTVGGEQLSVGGITRSFPSSTEMVVTEGSCATVKWEPLMEHVEGLVLCPAGGGGLTMTSATTDEEIAGVTDTNVISCPATAYFIPPDATPGQVWSSSCSAPDQRVAVTGRVLGLGTVTVGGQEVRALHTRIVLSLSGAETGTSPTDYWVAPGNGLILKEQETVHVSQKSGPLGSVRYDERTDLALASATPSV